MNIIKNVFPILFLSIIINTNIIIAANTFFINENGSWNTTTNWLNNHVPTSNDVATVCGYNIAVISLDNQNCGTIYCGNTNHSSFTPFEVPILPVFSKIAIRKNGNLNVEKLETGKNGRGNFSVCGGNLIVSKYIKLGITKNNYPAIGQLFVSAGNLKTINNAPLIIGYNSKGEMIVSWTGLVEAGNITVSEKAGSGDSVLRIAGGKLVADNITVNNVNGNKPSKILISDGKLFWKKSLVVNDTLKIQNSSATVLAIQKDNLNFFERVLKLFGFDSHDNSNDNASLILNNGSKLEFEFGANGIAPIILKNSKIKISPNAKLIISGTYYTRANGKSGKFLLIKHDGYSDEKKFKNVELSGFGNLIPSLAYEDNSISLVLKKKENTISRQNQGILMNYWELPIDDDVDKYAIFPPLTSMPSFDNTLIRTHPNFGKTVRKIDLSEILRTTNILVQFKGLVYIPKNGKYTFTIEYNEAIRLKIDDSTTGKDKSGISSLTLNLTNGMHKIQVGYYENIGKAKLKIYWSGPGFAKQEIPEETFFVPEPPKGYNKYYAFGNIMLDKERLYNYCPSFLFDEVEGLYKIWSGGAEDGDFILYKGAPTLDKLLQCPTAKVLHPTHSNKFDALHTCDPNVFVSDDGTFYLSYSGLADKKYLPRTTRVGMAISYDRGRTWTRLHNGNHITDVENPGTGYGTGQSAAVKANDGYYYMTYTHADKSVHGLVVEVMKCSDPSFPIKKQISVTNLHHGASIDLAYNAKKEEFIIISNSSCNPDKTSNSYLAVTMYYYDKNWNKIKTVFLKANTLFGFGEGAALLTDMKKVPLEYSYHEQKSYVFSAATREYKINTRLWASWVEGDTKYILFKVP
ncbi:MAG: hypothetical protein DRI44_06170, partial [Chlamydiae bacterium]